MDYLGVCEIGSRLYYVHVELISEKNANNLASLHTIVTGPALIDCA